MGIMEINMLAKGIDRPSLKLFKKEKLLGRGGFGKVWKVIFIRKNYPFALKEISKEKIFKNKMIESIFLERDILFSIYNEHIVNLYATFQDNNKLYMIMDYLEGRDLRNQMKIELFDEKQIKFLAGCIIIGLDYIHSKGIIHRDIKPENLVFDSKGYLRITDFGIAIMENKNNKNNDKSGTLCYMAPERLASDNNITYGYSSDFFSLGVILYELVTLQLPFKAFEGKIKNYIKPYKSLMEDIYNDKIMLKPDIANKLREDEIKYLKENKKDKFKYGLSNIKLCANQNFYNMCDFINKLLILDQDKRLGFNNVNEMKNHPWFSEERFSWKKLYHRTLTLSSNINNFLKESNESNDLNENKNKIENIKETETRNDNIQNIYGDKFNNFTLIHKVNSKEIDFLYMEGTYGKDNNINSQKRLNSARSNKNNNIIGYSNRSSINYIEKSVKNKKHKNYLAVEKENNSIVEKINRMKLISNKEHLLLHKNIDKNINKNLKLPSLIAQNFIIQKNGLKIMSKRNLGLSTPKKKIVNFLELKTVEKPCNKNFDNFKNKIDFLSNDNSSSFRNNQLKKGGQKSTKNLHLNNSKKYKIFLENNRDRNIFLQNDYKMNKSNNNFFLINNKKKNPFRLNEK